MSLSVRQLVSSGRALDKERTINQTIISTKIELEVCQWAVCLRVAAIDCPLCVQYPDYVAFKILCKYLHGHSNQ